MSRRVQPTRRANIRRTIAAIRQGTPERAPLHAADWNRWPRWVAGMRLAAKRGRPIARDLMRRPTRRPPLASGTQRYPKLRHLPVLPAQMARRTVLKGKGSGLRPLRESVRYGVAR